MKFAKIVSVAVLGAGVTLSAGATEQPVGNLSKVQGTVSVSGNGFASKAGIGTPVLDGSNILVSTDGRATVDFNEGCSVSLSGGQHLTINAKLNCSQQQAAVKQLFKPYRLAQFPLPPGSPPPPQQPPGGGGGGGFGGGGGGLGALAGLAGLAAIGYKVLDLGDKASPN